MFTRIEYPSAISASVSQAAGKPVEISPLFRLPTDTPTVAYIDSVVNNPEGDGTTTVHRYLLVQSGKDAKLRLIPCARSCQPRFYQKSKQTGGQAGGQAGGQKPGGKP